MINHQPANWEITCIVPVQILPVFVGAEEWGVHTSQWLRCPFLSMHDLVRGLDFFDWNLPLSRAEIPSLWAVDLGEP